MSKLFKWRGGLNRMKRGVVINELYPGEIERSRLTYKIMKGKVWIRYAHADWNFCCKVSDWKNMNPEDTQYRNKEE